MEEAIQTSSPTHQLRNITRYHSIESIQRRENDSLEERNRAVQNVQNVQSGQSVQNGQNGQNGRQIQSNTDSQIPEHLPSSENENNICIPMNNISSGWTRFYMESKKQYYWKNRNTQERVEENPFHFESEDEIPLALRNRWFEVYDDKMHTFYYVNPSLQIEQWEFPEEATDETEEQRQMTSHGQKAYYFKDYARQHFNLRRSFFREISVDELLHHDGKELQQPLLKMNPGLFKIALLVNHHIHSYCDDRQKEHIQRIIAYLLLSPEIMTDECYCQLLKQLTNCKSQYE